MQEFLNYPGYAMDEHGNVWTLAKLMPGKSSSYRYREAKLLKVDYSTKGSGRVTLYQNGKRIRRSVAVLKQEPTKDILVP